MRRLLRPLRPIIGRLTHRPKSRSELHAYWSAPTDLENAPDAYLTGAPRSEVLVRTIRQYATPDSSLLEIGCNAGRNLAHLHRAGFRKLTAIEISQPAVDMFRATFPEVADATTIHVGPVEQIIESVGQFDVVFTMAVLEHLHEDSSNVLAHIARATRDVLITIEDERTYGPRHFGRNYQRIFEGLGLRQVEFLAQPIGDLPEGFSGRVFKTR